MQWQSNGGTYENTNSNEPKEERMETKDTVIKLNHGGILSDVEVDSYNNGAEAQAEISFKVGIREVVEWITNPNHNYLKRSPDSPSTHYRLPSWALEAKLKEWEL